MPPTPCPHCGGNGWNPEDHPTMVSDGAAGEDDAMISGTPTETLEAALKYCVDLESGTETVWPGDAAFYVMESLLRREIERRG